MVKIDFMHAVKTLRHDEMLTVVPSEVSMLYPYIHSCYASHSFLHFSHFTLMSDEGTQQCYLLGSLLVCSTVMSLVKRIKSEFNCWYMDDDTLGGDADTLLKDFNLIVDEGRKLSYRQPRKV
jgi:hypothetical protein